jgi:hypothetical protein
MAEKYNTEISSSIPPAPDVLAVAAAASDEQDPIAAIQVAVDAHHNELVSIIMAQQLQLNTFVQPLPEEDRNAVDKAEDREKAMHFLDEHTNGMKDVRLFDPNCKKGNYTGDVIYLSNHHLVQQVGGVSFIIHDRQAVENEVAINDRLQIKYNAGKVVVNAVKLHRGQAVNESVTQAMSFENQKALAEAMKTEVPLNKEPDQEHEA